MNELKTLFMQLKLPQGTDRYVAYSPSVTHVLRGKGQIVRAYTCVVHDRAGELSRPHTRAVRLDMHSGTYSRT